MYLKIYLFILIVAKGHNDYMFNEALKSELLIAKNSGFMNLWRSSAVSE